jgi:hemerythrin-like domain-containing protein
MTGSPTFERLTRQALDEHGHIHFFLDQLANALDSLDSDSTDVEPLRRLAAHIAGLRERLGEHHIAEEKGGLFQTIVDAIPDTATEIHRLAVEHDRMIEMLEMARIHAERCDPSEAAALKEELQEFLELMRRHEIAEEKLLERAIQHETSSLP